MRTNKSIDVEKFWKIWSRVIEESEEGTLIVVEGYKDLRILRLLHVKGDIILSRIQDFWGTISIISRKNSKRVIILTDFDEEGEREAWKLKIALKNLGINVLDNIRKELKMVLGSIKRIEELKGFVDYMLTNAPFKFTLEEIRRELCHEQILS